MEQPLGAEKEREDQNALRRLLSLGRDFVNELLPQYSESNVSIFITQKRQFHIINHHNLSRTALLTLTSSKKQTLVIG